MREYTILNEKKIPLNIIEGDDIENPVAIIINIHGIGSHFQKVFESMDSTEFRENIFKENNMKMFALEFQGHGKSGGLRCSIDSFDDLVDDLLCLVKNVKDKFEELPIFFMAESMGGAVAIKYNIKYNFKYKIDGYILLSPMCGIDDSLKPNPILITTLISMSYVYPTLQALSTTSKIKDSCTNKKYIKMKESCEYFYTDKMRLNTARECYNTSLWIENNGHLFNSPLFLIHGLDDTVTNPNISIDFWMKIKNHNKEIYLPKNTNHGLLIGIHENDQHPRLVWQKILDWINGQLNLNQ